MTKRDFRKPVFTDGVLELRKENDIICIYGTADGLRQLANLIHHLLEHPNQGHIHLEGPELKLLTSASDKGAVAIFD